MSEKVNYEELTRFSAEIRKEMVRAIGHAGSGHIGGAASIADTLAVLYGGVMNIDPSDPKKADRDRLILSKGHCGPALYATLALKGYFPMDWLTTINQPHTKLPSHVDAQKTPGIDMSTGSLGNGVSAAVGVALGSRVQGIDNWTYCIAGDGETNEGEVWEAAETAAALKLDRLILFVDWNKKQLDGPLVDICDPIDLEAKFAAFGFDAKTINGHDVAAIDQAITEAKQVSGKPHAIILDTVKGMGIFFAETAEANHHMKFDIDKAEEACAEIDRRLAAGTYPGGDKA